MPRIFVSIALLPALTHASSLDGTAPATTLRHAYYALRHGQSLANVEGVISSDPRIACVTHGLSSEGWRQAESAAAAVASEVAITGARGVVVVSSDLRRAWQTASVVRAGCLASGIEVWPHDGLLEERALRERSFGELNGQGDERYADVWVEDAVSDTHERYEVESVRSVLERARAVVDRLEANEHLQMAAAGRRGGGGASSGRWLVVLVAHGDVLQILQTGFARVDPRTHRELEHLQTATLRGLDGGEWQEADASLIDPRWRHAATWPPPVAKLG